MRIREKTRLWVRAYKKNKLCQICGWNEHSEILQFHHTGNDKAQGVSELVNNNVGLERIKAEIDKCILICPNCHMWIHFEND